MQSKKFREKLLKVMDYRGETQKSLAIAMGVTPQCVNGYLGSKERMPGRDNLVELCRVLKMSSEYFTDDKVEADDFLQYKTDKNEIDENRKQRIVLKIFSCVQPRLMRLNADELENMHGYVNKML